MTILSAEEIAPYDRPPLSKSFLLGGGDEAALALVATENRW